MKFYCAVVAMMVLFVGCSSENEIVRQEDVISKVENPFNFVGELHNEGLAYVIDSMTTKTRAGETSSMARFAIPTAVSGSAMQWFVGG